MPWMEELWKLDKGGGSMKRKNYEICTELSMSLFHFRFFLGVLLLVLVFLAAAYPFRASLIEAGGSKEGPSWIVVFVYSISSDRSLLFLPLAVPLAAAQKAQEELKSRYTIFLISRAGRKNYLIGKAAGAALSGGIMVGAAFGIVLAVCWGWCAEIPNMSIPAAEAVYSVSGGYPLLTPISLIPGFICGFLNGALWALTGSAVSVLTRNHYLGYAVPFVLYYVLTVFQERYYERIYFLSPRQWAYPSYYSPGVCVVILLILGAAVSLLLVKVIGRRLAG